MSISSCPCVSLCVCVCVCVCACVCVCMALVSVVCCTGVFGFMRGRAEMQCEMFVHGGVPSSACKLILGHQPNWLST